MASEIIEATKQAMEKTIDAYERELGTIRTGRANASALANISIDYYGASTPITQIAAIKTPEAHLLVIEPWDKTSLKAIEKAIQASDRGITPNNDGLVIRLPFPAPTEERRKELVKQCRQVAEEARVSIRNHRRDGNNKLEKAKKDGDLPEDELHREEEQIQKITDKYVAKIDEVLKKKEAEVMEI